MAHIKIDFETLGKALDGKVSYVAFTSFEIDNEQTMEEIKKNIIVHKLNWKHEEQSNWKIDKGVMEFWAKLHLNYNKKC
jgi:hypothetical protein